jgi:CubicO group peptidase (beta-lactamase class C family)
MLFLPILITIVLALTPEELNNKLTQYVKDQQILGLALQITKNSSTIYRGNFGLRNKEKNLPVDNNTHFRSASLSKNVAAVGLYLLIE